MTNIYKALNTYRHVEDDFVIVKERGGEEGFEKRTVHDPTVDDTNSIMI